LLKSDVCGLQYERCEPSVMCCSHLYAEMYVFFFEVEYLGPTCVHLTEPALPGGCAAAARGVADM